MLLYRQLRRQLIANTQSGVAAPGAALPNESDLARTFDVSIGIVRRAVANWLPSEHVLVRQQGRGTFVGMLDRERFMFQFFKIAGRDGVSEYPQVRLHAFTRARANGKKRRHLDCIGVPAGSRSYNVNRHDWMNVQGLISVSQMIVESALARQDSRRAQFREDFPQTSALPVSTCTVVRQRGGRLELTREAMQFTRVRPGHTILEAAAA